MIGRGCHDLVGHGGASCDITNENPYQHFACLPYLAQGRYTKKQCLQLISYQYQFVKTSFPCIYSNRDMSLFSFFVYFTSVCIVKFTQSLCKVVIHGRGTWRPLFHALGMVFRLFWGGFVHFLRWEGVFRDLFPIFPAFSLRQNPFPSQENGKFNGKGFWRSVIKPKAMGRGFQKGLLLNYIISNFLVNFSSFWELVGLLWILTQNNWLLH